jgi:hypothetical protein
VALPVSMNDRKSKIIPIPGPTDGDVQVLQELRLLISTTGCMSRISQSETFICEGLCFSGL